MKRALPVLLLLVGLAGFFFYFAHSIVQVTLFQLRLDITRRELLHYELASGLLDARLQNAVEDARDFDGEIRISVLESSVLNVRPDHRALEPDLFEWSGLVGVNFVRMLNGKELLDLRGDARRLLLLQYAFFMQRKKRYDRALVAYQKLEREIDSGTREDRAFVLLHGAFCYALTGQFGDAVVRLKRVRAEFAGTHFAGSAAVLLDYLLHAGGETLREAENENLPAVRRARAYFRSGRFERVLALLESPADRAGVRERWIYARSLEETGRIEDAVAAYGELRDRAPDPGSRLRANRRLLLLGNFYGAGGEVKTKAERDAVLMGDESALHQLEKRKTHYEKPAFIERVRESGRAGDSDSLVDLIESGLKQALPEGALITETNATPIDVDRIKQDIQRERRERFARGLPLLLILKDGRRIRTRSVRLEGRRVVPLGGTRETFDVNEVAGILGDEERGVALSMDGIPMRGVKLGFEGGHMVVREP